MLRRKLQLMTSAVAVACLIVSLGHCRPVLADPGGQVPAVPSVGLQVLPTDTIAEGPYPDSERIFYCTANDTIVIHGLTTVNCSDTELLLDNRPIEQSDFNAKFNWLVEGLGQHTLSINYLSNGDLCQRGRPCQIDVVNTLPVAIGDFDRSPLQPFNLNLDVSNAGFVPLRMGVFLDGKPIQIVLAQSGYQCPIPVPDLKTGHHTLRIEAWDQTNNRYEFKDSGFDVPARFMPALPTSFTYTAPADRLPVGIVCSPGLSPARVDYYLKQKRGATGLPIGSGTFAPSFSTGLDVSSYTTGQYYLDIVMTEADGHSYEQTDVPLSLRNQKLDQDAANQQAYELGLGAGTAGQMLGRGNN
jgi:hypothetical protein